MEDGSPRLNRGARLRVLAAQVRDFAIDEAKLSGLPGQDQGPADAYRHLVGVAELSRCTGPLLAAEMAKNASAMALSYASPAEPVEGRTPASLHVKPKATDVYWLP